MQEVAEACTRGPGSHTLSGHECLPFRAHRLGDGATPGPGVQGAKLGMLRAL